MSSQASCCLLGDTTRSRTVRRTQRGEASWRMTGKPEVMPPGWQLAPDKRASIDWSGQLSGGRPTGSNGVTLDIPFYRTRLPEPDPDPLPPSTFLPSQLCSSRAVGLTFPEVRREQPHTFAQTQFEGKSIIGSPAEWNLQPFRSAFVGKLDAPEVVGGIKRFDAQLVLPVFLGVADADHAEFLRFLRKPVKHFNA